ncbi:MAG: DEAD/DEAH box helicase [Polyangiaceae bacterium]
MTEPDFPSALGPAIVAALKKRGFTSLTNVQETVLDADHEGRDLRITSQTGSGKTVAIGFALRDLAAREASRMGGIAHPFALVVTPTRELAKQVEEELSWLYEEVGAHVVSVTGGTSARDERRALASGPQIVVGTPGRMLDHLERGAIDASEVGAVVLDEADRLLDMGFREELDAILAHTPEERRTHLVSATFPREVRSLADAVQTDPAHVEGTRLGEANADIDHVLHLVDGRDRLSALVNILLANPDEQILVFARTRADVAEIADALAAAGFPASSLSGEMEQNQRDRALAGFKSGALRVLVATDVAARGIDVQDIARVVHAEPPGDADTYTHRSGRTGRAGRKGTSSTLVPPSIMGKVVRLLHRAGVKYRFERVPSAEDIRKAQDDALIAELLRDDPASAAAKAKAAELEALAQDAPDSGETTANEGEAAAQTEAAPASEKAPQKPVIEIDQRAKALAERLAKSEHVERTIARLLMRARQATGPEPRHVRPIDPPGEVARPSRRNPTGATRGAAPVYESDRPPPPSSRAPRDPSRPFTLFQVTWGEMHGAETRRMLAMLCRRGGIESRDVGSIRIGRIASTVEIASDVADQFAQAAGQVDERDPRIRIRPASFGAPAPFEGRRSDRPQFEGRRNSEPPPFEGRRNSEPPPFEGRRNSEPPPFEGRRAERPQFEGRRADGPPPFEGRRPAKRDRFERTERSAPPSERPRFEPKRDAEPPRDEAPQRRTPRAEVPHEEIAPKKPRRPKPADAAPEHAPGPRAKPKAAPKDIARKPWKKAAPAPAPGGDAPPKRRRIVER